MRPFGSSGYRVADGDHALSEDVCSQAAAMHQGPDDGPTRVAGDDPAGLAEPHPPAAHGADAEVAANEGVEVDPPGDDVAPVLVGQ